MSEFYPSASFPAPAVQNQQPPQASPEEEYRHALVNQLVESSVGTVGLYTSADFDPDEKASIVGALSQRNPGADFSRIHGQDGLEDYGEKTGLRVDDVLVAAFDDLKDDKEQLHFMQTTEGNVEVRYGFQSKGYVDAANRPSKLIVGFTLPEADGARLRDAVQADPSFINDVIKGQVLAVGIPEAAWTGKRDPSKPAVRLEPRYGMNDFVLDKDRKLTVIEHNPDTSVASQAKLVYGENKSILPAASEQAEDDDEDLVEIYKTDAKNEVAELAEEAPDEVGALVGHLAAGTHAYSLRLYKAMEAGDAAAQGENLAAIDGYNEAMAEFLADKVAEQGLERVSESVLNYLGTAMAGYIDEMRAAGHTVDTVPTPDAVNGFDKNLARNGLTAHQIQTVSSEYGSIPGVKFDPDDARRMFEQVRAEKTSL